jgi:hypothetical protein
MKRTPEIGRQSRFLATHDGEDYRAGKVSDVAARLMMAR